MILLEWYVTKAKSTGISYIDSTSIAVCHPKRISRNKVFQGMASQTLNWTAFWRQRLYQQHLYEGYFPEFPFLRKVNIFI